MTLIEVLLVVAVALLWLICGGLAILVGDARDARLNLAGLENKCSRKGMMVVMIVLVGIGPVGLLLNIFLYFNDVR